MSKKNMCNKNAFLSLFLQKKLSLMSIFFLNKKLTNYNFFVMNYVWDLSEMFLTLLFSKYNQIWNTGLQQFFFFLITVLLSQRDTRICSLVFKSGANNVQNSIF